MSPKATNVTILIVDDNDLDAMAIQRTLKKMEISNPVHRCVDGVEAIEYLQGSASKTSYIILMDVNMPRMDGIECVRRIREDKKLKRSVIFMMTTSRSDNDILKSYELNVAGYILKSDVSNGLMKSLSLLEHYLENVELPPS